MLSTVRRQLRVPCTRDTAGILSVRNFTSDRNTSPKRPKKITVFGSGSFGTAMGSVLARNGYHVTLLSRRTSVADYIQVNHRNPNYLTGYPLPFNLTATTDPAKALEGANYIVHSIPVQASENYLQEIRELIPPSVPIISTSKGMHTKTLQLMSDIIPSALGRSDHPTAFISGPSFAKELMEAWPTGVVAASASPELSNEVATLFTSQSMRVWVSDDVIGVELAGALKNVYAIASGMVEGLGLGLNTTSLLVTRAVAEMNRLAVALGANPTTLTGLSGIGDLTLTCYGSLSRNRTVGVRLGRGETMEEILASSSEAAEGVATTPAAHQLATKHGIHAPIIDAVNNVVSGTVDPVDALLLLMDNSVPPEAEHK